MRREKLPVHSGRVNVSYILYADDNEDMRHLVRTLLSAAGHETGLVPDGGAALASLAAREPDLLILDVAMPGLSGFDVCRLVKSNPFTARIPVLMLTAEGDVERKVEGFEAGADDYLAKPFDPRELRARVASLLRLVRRESDRNPTSGLPGGRAIEDHISGRVAAGADFAVCYIDLDNFKAFADTFGFSHADEVIRRTGAAIADSAAVVGGRGDFVGHIGGDDFLVVTTEEKSQAIADEAARRFRDAVAPVVGQEAMSRGTFYGVDRDGSVKEFPLACLSVAVLLVEPGRWDSMARLGARAAEVKRTAKARGAGTVVVERV